MAISDYSTTPGSNTSISGINIAENCSPAGLNNATRQMMADIKTWYDTVQAGGTYQPLDATLTALAALTTAADKGLYATASDTFATYDLTSFGRSLVAVANAAAARTLLGVLEVSASSLANPGYIKFNVSGTILTLQWGSGTLAGNSSGTITYPTSFSTFGVCIVSGGSSSTSNEGDIHPYTASGLSSQAIVNSAASSGSYQYLAIGV